MLKKHGEKVLDSVLNNPQLTTEVISVSWQCLAVQWHEGQPGPQCLHVSTPAQDST